MSSTIPRLAFVDFMYAIVVGSAFPLIAPPELSFRFVGMLFLLLLVLEDFYLYHTEIQGSTLSGQGGFLALVIEIGILLAWYLSAISFPVTPHAFLGAFVAFYLLKLLAGIAHFSVTGQLRSWRFYRSLSFLIPAAAVGVLVLVGWGGDLSSSRTWPVIVAASALQVGVWWLVTERQRSREEQRA